jgi:hypothetical protein
MSELPIPKNLSTWLTDPKGQAGCYANKAKQLIMLNQLWKQQKDTPLMLHSTIANWADSTLVIAIARSEWAAQLHYAQFELLARLKTWPGLAQLTRINWYVQAPLHCPQDTVAPSSGCTLSQENKQLIQSVADTLSHPPLQAALRQLAVSH